VERADAAPTSAQQNALTETEKDFTGSLKRWAEIKETELPELNRQLRGANLLEIRLTSSSPEQDASDDVE
jgi:hypothetical protein